MGRGLRQRPKCERREGNCRRRRFLGDCCLNPYFTIAVLGALVAVGALIATWLDQRRGPIDWVLNSTGSPVAFWQSADGPLLISSFNVIGSNRTDYPVALGDSFIRSDINNQMLRFRIGVPGGDIQTTEATVEPKGSVIMVADYPLPDAQRSGITVERFRSEFGPLHIFYELRRCQKIRKIVFGKRRRRID